MSLNQVDRQIQHCCNRMRFIDRRNSRSSRPFPMPCWRRIARLEQEGYIKGKVALLDELLIGFDMLVYAHVRLSNHGRDQLADFEKLIMSYDEVTECYTMAGTMDFMLRIISKGIEGYEQFVRDHLLSLPYVQEVHSNVTMTCVKRSTALPHKSGSKPTFSFLLNC